jgi:hypothetical protein
LRVVLDTCILKLATFPAENNASALIFGLARAGLIEAWVSPAILEEYADVLADRPEFVAEIVESSLHLTLEPDDVGQTPAYLERQPPADPDSNLETLLPYASGGYVKGAGRRREAPFSLPRSVVDWIQP